MFKLHVIFSTFFYIILHFCLGNPTCNQASMPSGILAQLMTLGKNEYGPLRVRSLSKWGGGGVVGGLGASIPGLP